MTGRICGTGACAPAHVVDNDDIAKRVETSDSWIRERTGVVRRHIIGEETTVSMAAAAGERALADAGMRADEVDLILVSTITSNVVIPSTACEVQRILGAKNATCFDLNAACTGFLFAYNTAMAYFACGMYRTALIIGSESLSDIVDWSDRNTCILFGDGAGAVALRAVEGHGYRAVTHSDGSRGNALTCRSRNGKETSFGDGYPADTFVRMDGKAIFKFAVKAVQEVTEEVLAVNRTSKEEIDYFVLHQANQRIVEAIARRLDVDIAKFPMNLDEYGNTSSASIPILLDELRRSGRLVKGQKILMAGFGGGLSWGAGMLEWD